MTPRGDGLALIRERVTRSPRWWQPAAGLAAAAAAVAIAVFALGDTPQQATTVAEQPAARSAPEPVTPAEPTPTGQGGTGGSASPNPGGQATTGATSPPTLLTVPVYYLHDDTTRLGLYREYHRVPQQGGGRAPTAVQQLLSAPALDPDYTSLWAPGTRVLSYQRDGAVATIDLSAEALSGTSAGSAAAELSLQQLVYTVTAAENDSSLTVALTVEGEPVEQLWGAVAADRPVGRAPSLDVLGQAWLLTPGQGATVRSPVDLTVYGTAFEGHTVLRVFPIEASEPVVDTFVTTSMGQFSQATHTAQLPAGRYVVRVYTEQGEAMTLLERDSKEFTVR
jgi:spore germination protein GerM